MFNIAISSDIYQRQVKIIDIYVFKDGVKNTLQEFISFPVVESLQACYQNIRQNENINYTLTYTFSLSVHIIKLIFILQTHAQYTV